MQQQKNRVEVQGNNLHFVFLKTKENANYSPEPRLCSFVAAQFETSSLPKLPASVLFRKREKLKKNITKFSNDQNKLPFLPLEAQVRRVLFAKPVVILWRLVVSRLVHITVKKC